MSMGAELTGLNRRGRKRKGGYRRADGRVIEAKPDYRARAALWPHRGALPAEVRTHPLAETPFGVLRLLGFITEEQHRAGEVYARIVGKYRQVIEAPSPAPRSIAGAGEGIRGGGYPLADGEARRRTERYNDAFEAICTAGQRSAKATARIAVYGFPASDMEELDHLRRGLDALVRHLGLTTGGKSGGVH